MKLKQKNIIAIILGVLALLAIVAVVIISQRLSTDQPVAPTAPKSRPSAGACSTEFTVPNAGLQICKVIAKDRQVQSTWANIPESTFTIDIHATGEVDGGVATSGAKLATVSFSSSDTPATTLSDGSKAVCKTVPGVTGYNVVAYKAEAISNNARGWKVPLYHDALDMETLVFHTFSGNQAGDPAIELSETQRTIVIKNEYITPGVAACKQKTAYKNVTGNTAGSYSFTDDTKITEDTNIAKGDQLVYRLEGESLATATIGSVVWKDTLNQYLEFVDGSSCFTYDSATRTLTCDLGTVNANASYDVAFRVRVLDTIPDAYELQNTARITTDGANEDTCAVVLATAPSPSPTPAITPSPTPTVSPSPSPTASPSPTPTPSPSPTPGPTATPAPYCGTTCSSNADCPSTMICSSGACRNPSCTSAGNCICATATPAPIVTPSPTPYIARATATPVPRCGTSCAQNSDCPSDMICSSGACRNPSCSSSTTCLCATEAPVPTATPEQLPVAGTSTPTLAIMGAAVLIITIGLLGLLAI